MIIAPPESVAQILIVLVLATAAVIIVKRDMRSLIRTYAIQSLLLAVMALLLFVESGILTLLGLAVLITVSKVVVIPYFMEKVQKRLNIKRDVQFHFLSPITALFASVFIVLFVYLSFSKLIAPLNIFNGSLFFLGATVGLSLLFMGMIVIFTRKQTITNIVGYLTMENGVVLFSLFLTEIPLLIEVLIVVDLIMLTLLATILAFGIDSTIEEFHQRLNIFQDTSKKAQSGFEKDDSGEDDAAVKLSDLEDKE
jgi:hydrogenase-4 component E